MGNLSEPTVGGVLYPNDSVVLVLGKVLHHTPCLPDLHCVGNLRQSNQVSTRSGSSFAMEKQTDRFGFHHEILGFYSLFLMSLYLDLLDM